MPHYYETKLLLLTAYYLLQINQVPHYYEAKLLLLVLLLFGSGAEKLYRRVRRYSLWLCLLWLYLLWRREALPPPRAGSSSSSSSG